MQFSAELQEELLGYATHVNTSMKAQHLLRLCGRWLKCRNGPEAELQMGLLGRAAQVSADIMNNQSVADSPYALATLHM